MERLLTTEEVAELLRIDPVTVRRLVTRGDLVAYRIAGEYRFSPASVENFVESQRVVVSAPGPRNPDSKFTERARTVFDLSSEEARRYNHSGIGPEHLLLGIMSEGEGIAAQVLQRLQVQPGEVRAQVEKLHPASEQPITVGQLGMTAQGKQTIELAVQEARSLGLHYIGTEHLLLGLLREEESLASQVLLKSGATLDRARELVIQLLAAGQTTNTSEPEKPGEA